MNVKVDTWTVLRSQQATYSSSQTLGKTAFRCAPAFGWGHMISSGQWKVAFLAQLLGSLMNSSASLLTCKAGLPASSECREPSRGLHREEGATKRKGHQPGTFVLFLCIGGKALLY